MLMFMLDHLMRDSMSMDISYLVLEMLETESLEQSNIHVTGGAA